MNEERHQYVEDMLDLFQTEGWKWLIADLSHTEDMFARLDGVSTIEDLHYAKGVLWATRNIIRIPDEIREAADEDEDA